MFFHPRFQFGRNGEAVNEFVEVGSRFKLRGFCSDFVEALAQEIKRQLADRFRPSSRGRHLRGEFNGAPRTVPEAVPARR